MREHFDGNTIRKARNAAARNEETKFFDTACSGLAIRIYKSGRASWCILSRDWKATIADLSTFTAEDIPALRGLVPQARFLKKSGKDPSHLVNEFVSRKDADEAGVHADVKSGEAETWDQARDSFLVWVKENRAADTHRGYKSSLGAIEKSPLHNDFEPMNGKPLASVTLEDMVIVRENIIERGRQDGSTKIRQANLTVAALKSFWKWQRNRVGNPIPHNPSLELGKAANRKNRLNSSGNANLERALSQKEIGLVIAGLYQHHNIAARTALMLQLLTGQRRLSVAQARKESFYENPEIGIVWRLEDKTQSWRVIPLPPRAKAAYDMAISLTRLENPYLFPQMRERRMGGGMEGHMNERTISKVFEDLRSADKILSKIPMSVATHDLRRALITHMSPKLYQYEIGGRQLSDRDISMITHADEGKRDTASLVYDKSERLDVKLKILSEWEKFCFDGYEMIRKERGLPPL